MSNRLEIGKLEDGRGLCVDLGMLIEGKLAVQASSGGGKSMTLRTLLEQTHGLAPQIILDKDGEYSTLRERHDYILAGKAGDIPTSVKTASMLARRVMELDLSIIVDLYDLPTHEKHKFMRLFLEGIFHAPKELWRDRLVVVDEAHRFCPENGEGTSEAKEIIIECCDDGRKRGLGMILATQRIAKLDKSALAECENKLIGRTNYDDDRRRAGRELGFSSKADLLSLRDLKRGQFFAQGRALSNEVVKATIHMAKTTHPSAGHRMVKKAPAPTAKVKAVLAKLKDLPQEAEAEAKTVAELQDQLRKAKLELVAAKKAQPKAAAPVTQVVQAPVDKTLLRQLAQEAFESGFDQGFSLVSGKVHQVLEAQFQAKKAPRWEPKQYKTGALDVTTWEKLTKEPRKAAPAAITVIARPRVNQEVLEQAAKAYNPGQVFGPTSLGLDLVPVDGAPELTKCERKIVSFLNIRPGRLFTLTQVAAMSSYRVTSGSFKNAVAHLNSLGILNRGTGTIALKPELADQLGVEAAPHSVSDWEAKLSKCEREIFKLLLDDPDKTWTTQDLADATPSQYKVTSGSFKNALARLSTAGLMIRPEPGCMKFNDELKAEGLLS